MSPLARKYEKTKLMMIIIKSGFRTLQMTPRTLRR